MTDRDTNGWSKSELYVMEELKRLADEIAGMRTDLTNLRVEVAHKGAIWGALSGAAVGVVGWLVKR